MRLSCALLLPFAVVASVFVGGKCRNPGVKTVVTKKGLDYGMKVFMDILKDQLKHIHDQSSASGHFSYQLTNIRINAINFPTTRLDVVPNTGLKLQASGVSVSLRGNWRYRYKKGWVSFSDHGSLDLSIHGGSLAVALHLGKDYNARPSVSVGPCSAQIGDVKLGSHGGLSWVYNLFKGILEKKIKHLLNSEICKAVTKAINVDVEKFLAGIRVSAPIGAFADLDLGLIENPTFHTNSIELPLKGYVVSRKDRRNVLVPEAAPIPFQVDDASSMLYLHVSDSVGNSIANMYHQVKVGQSLTLNDMKEFTSITEVRPFLNTGSLKNLLAQVYKKYPDRPIELVLQAFKAPSLSILKDKAELTMYGRVHVSAVLKTNEIQDLFFIDVTMALDAKELEVVEERLHFKVSIDSEKVKISTGGSSVGPVPLPSEFVVPIVCKFAESWMNKYLEKGIPVFHQNDVKFLNGQVKMNKGYISIGTDVSYKGKP